MSTRLIKPTMPQIDVSRVLEHVKKWDPNYEMGDAIMIFDEGLAQYLLVDEESHHIFYASLILRKPSLRCTLSASEPHDFFDESGDNHMHLVQTENKGLSSVDHQELEYLKEVLGKRGYRFAKD